jgi:hypothetical protein
VSEEHRAGDEDRFVNEERKLSVSTRRHEERRRKAATDCHQCQALRTLSIGQPRRQHGNGRHDRERKRLPHQVVEVESGIRRHVQDGDAAPGDQLPVQGVSGADEPKSAIHQQHSDDAALDDTCCFADPAVLNRELLEIARSDDDGHNANVEKPARPDSSLQ